MKKSLIISSIAILICSAVSAQGLRSGYFVENYRYGSYLNPAFAPDQGSTGLVISNLQASLGSNLSVPGLLYQTNNGLATFLHPDVDAATALSAFSKSNFINADASLDILNLSVRKKKAYYTFDLGVRASLQSNIPYDMFAFLKEGMTTTGANVYNLEDLSIYAHGGLQAAFGFSRSFLSDGLRVGARVKAIAAVFDGAVGFDKFQITASGNEWSIATKGSLYGHIPGFTLQTDEDGYVSGINKPAEMTELANVTSISLAGDLGISYTFPGIFKGLQLSAAVNDLRIFTNTFDTGSFYAESGSTVTYKGFENFDPSATTEGGNPFEGLQDDFQNMVKFKVDNRVVKSKLNLVTKAYAGARYSMLKDHIIIGALYSASVGQYFVDHGFMGSLTLRPGRWISLTGTYSRMTSGESVGALLTFTPRFPLNFFIGADCIPLHYSAGFVPLDALHADVQFGLCIPVGKVFKTNAKKEE